MGSAASCQAIEFRLLGPFEVVAGQRALAVGTGKQRALLALLVLRLNEVVSRSSLIGELWDEEPPASATVSLHSLVSRLRRALSDVAGGVALQTREPGYVLEGDPECVDAYRFGGLCARAREQLGGGEPEAAVRMLRDAMGLWHGRPLIDLGEMAFARREAERLEQARLAAVEDLADAELACGRPAEAVVVLEPHVEGHPFRERAWGQLMVSLYRLGRQADALSAYQRVRKVISEELGVDPTPALRELESKILHQSPDLDGPRPSTAMAGPASVAPRALGDTVAFLFTDIEASTRRWEGNQEAMARDLALHDELLRSVVARTHGVVFTHTGDGLAAAFSAASEALAAAVAGQRTLAEQQWDATGPLRVRMAVHAGAAEQRSGTYFGPALNRVARLLALASGGQVLCSQTAADLARDDLPDGLSLVDLGEHALADLTRPERIFQVAASGLAGDFPSLRSAAAPRHNLPVALSAFVGRASELSELTTLVGGTRLLTLTGVGGAGKTRLAVELATAKLDTFPDGVWLAELGPLQDPTLVVTEVSTAVGLPQEAMRGRPGRLEEQLCAHLRGRRALIVLDNCEHLIDACAQLAHAVLAQCPEVRLVATSREVLGLPGEVVWRVPSLSLPSPGAAVQEVAGSDAVALFCDRARAAHAGFALSEANAAAVVKICRRLDGIPLALELAAARLRMLSAHQVAEHLHDRFRLLTGGARTAVPRHQTLRAAMDWSHEGLPLRERAVLRRLSVFPGSFDLDAAEAVARDDGAGVDAIQGFEVLHLLSRLIDKSLVVVQTGETEVRYQLLETVRQYAAERLAEGGESRAAHRGHRDHFLRPREWQGEVGGWPDDEPWLRRLDTDEDNFRAALLWSLEEGDEEPAVHLCALMWIHWFWGGRAEGVGWLEQALAGPRRVVSAARVEAMVGLAFLLSVTEYADPDRSARVSHEALEMADRLGDRNGQVRSRYVLADLAVMRGETDRARQLIVAAVERCDESDVAARGWCLYVLASAAVAGGTPDEAMPHLEQALDLARRGCLPVLTAHVLATLAPLAALAGDTQRATALAGEALSATARLDWHNIRAMTLTRATEARILTGDLEARATVCQLLRLLGDLRARSFVADALEMAALVAEQGGRLEPAARLLGSAEMLREAHGEPFGGTRALSPAVRACPSRVLEMLGAVRYDDARTTGRNTAVEEAIAFALAELDSRPPRRYGATSDQNTSTSKSPVDGSGSP